MNSNKTERGYDKWAINFDKDINPHLILEHDDLVNLISPKKNEKILDIGCGTGRLIKEFNKSNSEVIGIDISKNMINIAKKKFPNNKFIKLDISKKKLPFTSNSFDKIVCAQVFDHLKNADFVLKEFERVLKQGGKIFISASHPDVHWDLIEYRERYYSIDIPSETDLFYKSFPDYLNLFFICKLKVDKIIELPVSNKIKKFLSKKSWEKAQGSYEIVIFELSKRKFNIDYIKSILIHFRSKLNKILKIAMKKIS